MISVALLTLLVACKDDPPPPGGGDPTETGSTDSTDTGTTTEPLPEGCDTVSWELTGKPFLNTWCTSCHSSLLEGDERYGATDNVDFDTYDGAAFWEVRIEDRTFVAQDMPPAGGISEEELEQFALWLDCGLPGEPDAPPADCSGDVATVSEVPASCGDPVAVSGDVTLSSDTDLSCVCSIDGDLQVTGGDIRLAALHTVTGDLTISGGTAVDVPSLAEVGGGLSVTSPELLVLSVRRLDLVGSDVVVEGADALSLVPFVELSTATSVRVADNAALTGLDLSRLESVSGDLVVSGNPKLETLFGEGYALDAVGGDLVLADNPGWGGFYGFAHLDDVGGDLRIENVGWESVQGFTALGRVGGTLRIADNATLSFLDGFDQLVEVGGDLEVRDNAMLGAEDAFDFLDVIGGTLRIVNNPRLTVLYGVVLPTSIGGLEVGSNDQLPGFGGLNNVTAVYGDVLIYDLPSAQGLDGMHSVSSVGGDVTISGLPQAGTAVFLDDAENVGGTVLLEDLPQLRQPQILARMRFVGGDMVQRRVGWTELRTGSNFSQVSGALVLEQNFLMTKINDLGGVTALGGLRVADNPVLDDLGGLAGITSVDGDLELARNGALGSLAGLSDVATISGDLRIDDNDDLTSVVALHGVSMVGGDLSIVDNDSLSTADAQALATAIPTVSGSTTVSGNAP